MKNCNTCKHKDTDKCFECFTGEEYEKWVVTNFDSIKAMSMDELVEFMQKCGWDYPPYCGYRKIQECDQNCIKCAKEWLESEVEGE